MRDVVKNVSTVELVSNEFHVKYRCKDDINVRTQIYPLNQFLYLLEKSHTFWVAKFQSIIN